MELEKEIDEVLTRFRNESGYKSNNELRELSKKVRDAVKKSNEVEILFDSLTNRLGILDKSGPFNAGIVVGILLEREKRV